MISAFAWRELMSVQSSCEPIAFMRALISSEVERPDFLKKIEEKVTIRL